MASFLKILTDLDCELWIDQEMVGEIHKELLYKHKLQQGEYILEFKFNGNTIKSFEYTVNNNTDYFLKVKLTRKINISIIDNIVKMLGGWVIEGELIDNSLINILISFDNVNWEKLKHNYVVPLNYCGFSLKFNYGYPTYDDGLDTIYNSYHVQLFFEKNDDYEIKNRIRQQKLIASLHPFKLNHLKEFEEHDIDIIVNISWLNVKEINSIFINLNGNWEIRRFGEGLKSYTNFSIDSKIQQILGIDLPYLLVSNGEKQSIFDISRESYLLPFEYDEIYNECRDDNEIFKHFYNIAEGFKIEKNLKVGAADFRGNIIIEPKYKNVYKTYLGYICVTEEANNNWLIYNTGESYDDIFGFNYGSYSGQVCKLPPSKGITIFYSKNNNFGWWKRNGLKEDIEVQEIRPSNHYSSFASYECYDEELFYAKKDNKWGLVSSMRGVIVPFKYDDIFDFSISIESLIFLNEIDKVKQNLPVLKLFKRMLNDILQDFAEYNIDYNSPIDIGLTYDDVVQKGIQVHEIDNTITVKGKITGIECILSFTYQ